MKQPELPGEMQTTYINLEAALDVRFCCGNPNGLLARGLYICKIFKPCEWMRLRTALELDPPSPRALPNGLFLPTYSTISRFSLPAGTRVSAVPLLAASTEPTLSTILQAALTLPSVPAPASQCSSSAAAAS